MIVLLAGDEFASKREYYKELLSNSYHDAFDVIANDENAKLIVVKEQSTIISFAQINFMTHLT